MRRSNSTTRPGYALIAVLIVVVVLSLAAYRYADAMTSEYSVAVRASESAQAKTAAISGVHVAMGALADPATFNDLLGGDPSDNPSLFGGIALEGEDAPLGGTRFSLFHIADTGAVGSGESRYLARHGLADESAKLNINALILLDPTGQLLYDALMKLPNMTEEIADSIVDWVDSDDSERPAGAESGYYSGLPTPYKAKNGPLNSVEELLLAGVPSQLLFGNDRNRNGRRDLGEDDGGEFSRGWSEFLTVYGRELDADPQGNQRLNIGDQNADMVAMSTKLTSILGQQVSDYIVAARLYGTTAMPTTTFVLTETVVGSTGSSGTMQMRVTFAPAAPATPATIVGGPNELRAAVQTTLDSGTARAKGKLNSVLTLQNTRVTLPKPANAPMDAPTVVIDSPFNDVNTLKAVLPQLLDWTTTRTTFEMTPRINVNTAPPEVLLTIPGLTQPEVDTIVATRDSLSKTDPATTTAAWLVTQANISPTTFRNIERYVTGKSMTYRVQSVGYFGRGGAIARVEAVIDTNQGHPRIVYYRDLTDLGKGFDLPR